MLCLFHITHYSYITQAFIIASHHALCWWNDINQHLENELPDCHLPNLLVFQEIEVLSKTRTSHPADSRPQLLAGDMQARRY